MKKRITVIAAAVRVGSATSESRGFLVSSRRSSRMRTAVPYARILVMRPAFAGAPERG